MTVAPLRCVCLITAREWPAISGRVEITPYRYLIVTKIVSLVITAGRIVYLDGGRVSPGKEKMSTHTDNALGVPIRSVFLECRQWRDKTAGQTYTSARLWINGRGIAYFGLQYGGLDNMEDTAALYLEKVGALPVPDNYGHLYYRLRQLGVDYYSATEWRIRRECWLSGEQLTAEELAAELSANFFRAVAL